MISVVETLHNRNDGQREGVEKPNPIKHRNGTSKGYLTKDNW